MIKKLVPPIIYYPLIIFTIYICVKNFRSGPCAPNLDMLSILILVPLSAILVPVNGFRSIRNKNWLPFLPHLIGFTILLLALKFI